jgi:hypothetical protein
MYSISIQKTRDESTYESVDDIKNETIIMEERLEDCE